MKFYPFVMYIRQKRQWQDYIASCLWVQAVGMTYSTKDGTATLPRWHEVIAPSSKTQTEDAKLTKDDVKAQFVRLKNGQS